MKAPFIKNMHDFATIAKTSGYTLNNNEFAKRWEYPGDIAVECKINAGGEISFEVWQSNISLPPLSKIDKEYFLKDILYLVEWREVKRLVLNEDKTNVDV